MVLLAPPPPQMDADYDPCTATPTPHLQQAPLMGKQRRKSRLAKALERDKPTFDPSKLPPPALRPGTHPLPGDRMGAQMPGFSSALGGGAGSSDRSRRPWEPKSLGSVLAVGGEWVNG